MITGIKNNVIYWKTRCWRWLITIVRRGHSGIDSSGMSHPTRFLLVSAKMRGAFSTSLPWCVSLVAPPADGLWWFCWRLVEGSLPGTEWGRTWLLCLFFTFCMTAASLSSKNKHENDNSDVHMELGITTLYAIACVRYIHTNHGIALIFLWPWLPGGITTPVLA